MNTSRIRTPRVAVAVAIAALMTTVVAVAAPGASDAAGKKHQADRVEQAQARQGEQARQGTDGKSKAAAAVPDAAPAADAQRSDIVWRDEFNDGDYAGWTPGNVAGRPGKSQAIFRPANLSFANGKLVVTTQRHCGSVDAPPTKGKCPKGTSVYTSGRLDRAAPLPNGDFRVAFRAQVPQNGKRGQRSALWVKNAKPYCNADVAGARLQGELDVLEHYGAQKGRSYGVSHLSCRQVDADTFKAYQVSKDVAFDPSGYHVWSVERRGGTFRYFVDSKLVGAATCGEGKLAEVGKSRCDNIVEQAWTYTIQGEVFAKGYGKGKLLHPDETSGFPPQKLKVDWVRVYRL